MRLARASLLIATAVLLVGLTASLVPRIEAQGVGASSLSGMVCAQDENVYIRAPDKGCGGGGIANATVHLTQPGPLGSPVGGADRTVTAGADGAYSIGQLADGEYTLETSRPHFTAVKETVKVAGDTRHDVVLAGQDMKQPGRVVGAQGKPIAGARVTACCAPGSGGQGEATTAADGSFTIATRAGWRSLNVADASGYEDSYEYRLLDGTPVTVTLQPKPAPDAFLAGDVRDQDGNAVAGARIDAYSYGPPMRGAPDAPDDGSGVARPYYGGGSNFTLTAADGSYRLGVYSGSVNVNVAKDGYATRSASVDVPAGQTVAHDVRLPKYPPKDAHVAGRVTDLATGDGLRAVSITIRSSEYGMVECSDNGMQPSPGPMQVQVVEATASPAYREPGGGGGAPACAIHLDADGRFSGDVTPGYSVIDVYYERYLACSGNTDADGSSTRTCGPDYFPWTMTVRLASGDNRVDIPLQARPGPDAVVSGYILDGGASGDEGKAIAGATIWFSNQDNGAYGQATTDKDGSFKVRLRSGYHLITAQAPSPDGRPSGFLTWQGVLRVEPGDNPFDVTLTRGEEAAGCCYPMGYAYATATVAPAMAPSGPSGSGGSGGGAHTHEGIATQPTAGGGLDQASSGKAQAPADASQFEDLGGGLGPYDAESRQGALGSGGKASPSLELVALAAVLGAVAAVLRGRRHLD